MTKGTILITGASSGLGAEMARQFAELGYDLALCARRTDRLVDLAKEIQDRNPSTQVEVRRLDVTEDAEVFKVFADFADTFGTIDRVIINSGLGKGAAIGTGRADANRETAMVNFIGALTQSEAALEIFRRQERGHLVMISSISALRGMRKAMTTYAATKAGVAALAEGIRSENIKGLDVTVIFPGYIRSEMNERVAQETKMMVDTETGVKAIVGAIEKRVAKAYVPAWPWVPIGVAMKTLPLSVVRKLS